LGEHVWYTLADYGWYTLGDSRWYSIARLLTDADRDGHRSQFLVFQRQ
jgi:hypothetical protein